MTIGGGLNEPRDVLGVSTLALLSSSKQLELVLRDPKLWGAVFEESIRWVAPIGMVPRQTVVDTELDGYFIPRGAKLGLCILSANRDRSVWSDPDRFDIERGSEAHLAFGKGVHVCLGAWAARSQVADVGLPALFSRLKGLRLDPNQEATHGGWVFRGPLSLPLVWDKAVRSELA
ncbi:cytochrome P450 [Paenarthrobacter nitroguajacolicus]|nr:cytochrome P450 [Paenarthrobacter nitroguajacolicus]